MFERYTEKARRTIFFARYEASKLGSPYIEEEHLLLAFVREDKLFLMNVLPAGRSIPQFVVDIEALCQHRPALSTSVDLPFSPGVKRVLAYGAEEAEQPGDRHIGVEHLLLGVLKENPERLRTLFQRYRLTSERVLESLDKPHPGTWQHRSSAAALADVQQQFSSLTERLTPEVEPALVYKP